MIHGLRHLALRVRDLGRSRVFYENLFGFHVVWQPDSEHLYLSSGADNLALHQISGGELPAYQTPSCQRMDHFGFLVRTPQDVDRLHERFRGEGVRIVQGLKRHRDGSYSFYLADPDDNVVQVLYEPTISALEYSRGSVDAEISHTA